MKNKRKGSNNSYNIHQNKRQKLSDPIQDEIVKNLCERRSQEIWEIVTRENELYRKPQRKGNVEVDTIKEECADNYLTDDDEDDLDEQERKAFERFVVKERQNAINDLTVISKQKALNALNLLEPNTKKTKKKLTDEEKRLNYLKKSCNRDVLNFKNSEPEHTWDSNMYIVKSIRTCILTRNWDNLTDLLSQLLKRHKKYVSFVKQVALLNLMNNPSDFNGEILDEFYKLTTAQKKEETL